jgi:hypothetical protein
MRVLLKEYGSYGNLPLKINSSILEIEEYNMTEALRSKHKIIGHLSISAEFKFIEVDLTHLVSYKTFECYEKQIRVKENLRKRRNAQEQKYNEKASLIQEKKHEYYLRNNLVVNTKRLSKITPEWDNNENTKEESWFTLDGKQIQIENKAKPHKIWEGSDQDDKEEEKDIEANKENTDDITEENVWDEFEIMPQEFPDLGGFSYQKQEKIPVIMSKLPSKKNSNKKDNSIKNKLNPVVEDKEFTLEQFMIAPNKGNRNKKKRKGRK